MQAWEEGGYSDDMTATSLCGKHGLSICSPPSAVFAQAIDANASAGIHWEYLRRCALHLHFLGDSFLVALTLCVLQQRQGISTGSASSVCVWGSRCDTDKMSSPKADSYFVAPRAVVCVDSLTVRATYATTHAYGQVLCRQLYVLSPHATTHAYSQPLCRQLYVLDPHATTHACSQMLCRQLYVLDTYTESHNCCAGSCMC